MGKPQVLGEAGQPQQQATLQDHHRRQRAGRRIGRGLSRRARLSGRGVHLSRLTRRAHSIAAQGGINAAKNYRNDGDSVFRLFYDTLKGGDYRGREGNVYRLAQVSVNIIDQAVAQGVPFAREYGGLLDTRSFGGAQVARTFYSAGQTGQQLLLGAYQQMMRQVNGGHRQAQHPARDARPRGQGRQGGGHRHPRPGHRGESPATPVTPWSWPPAAIRMSSSSPPMPRPATSAHLAGSPPGAAFANPCYTQIHPTCIPADEFQSKLTLMSESLRNDGRIWVPSGSAKAAGQSRSPNRIATTSSSGCIRPSATWSPATWQPGRQADGRPGQGSRPAPQRGLPRLRRRHRAASAARWSRSATPTSSRCTSGSPTRTPTRCPMRIYPAVHYTMGGLWVDYNLTTTIPGLYAIGEANFSDHGANRLGASALMQGLADGYFVAPHTIGDYLAGLLERAPVPIEDPAFQRSRPRSRTGSRGSCPARGPGRWTGITGSWGRSCGRTAGCPGAAGSGEGAVRDPGPIRGVQERRAGAGHQTSS